MEQNRRREDQIWTMAKTFFKHQPDPCYHQTQGWKWNWSTRRFRLEPSCENTWKHFLLKIVKVIRKSKFFVSNLANSQAFKIARAFGPKRHIWPHLLEKFVLNFCAADFKLIIKQTLSLEKWWYQKVNLKLLLQIKAKLAPRTNPLEHFSTSTQTRSLHK